jgi:hypothetical protein
LNIELLFTTGCVGQFFIIVTKHMQEINLIRVNVYIGGFNSSSIGSLLFAFTSWSGKQKERKGGAGEAISPPRHTPNYLTSFHHLQ